MTTDTLTRHPGLTHADEYLAVLNDKERARRAEVNAAYFGEHSRLLYAEGSQYATFTLDKPGRRYTRVVSDVNGHRHVHAFIDNVTGDVLKAATWAAPAKGARYSLADDASRARLFAWCEFSGGYLYRDALKTTAAA